MAVIIVYCIQIWWHSVQ